MVIGYTARLVLGLLFCFYLGSKSRYDPTSHFSTNPFFLPSHRGRGIFISVTFLGLRQKKVRDELAKSTFTYFFFQCVHFLKGKFIIFSYIQRRVNFDEFYNIQIRDKPFYITWRAPCAK